MRSLGNPTDPNRVALHDELAGSIKIELQIAGAAIQKLSESLAKAEALCETTCPGWFDDWCLVHLGLTSTEAAALTSSFRRHFHCQAASTLHYLLRSSNYAVNYNICRGAAATEGSEADLG
jgi:hypothetical protein